MIRVEKSNFKFPAWFFSNVLSLKKKNQTHKQGHNSDKIRSIFNLWKSNWKTKMKNMPNFKSDKFAVIEIGNFVICLKIDIFVAFDYMYVYFLFY